MEKYIKVDWPDSQSVLEHSKNVYNVNDSQSIFIDENEYNIIKEYIKLDKYLKTLKDKDILYVEDKYKNNWIIVFKEYKNHEIHSYYSYYINNNEHIKSQGGVFASLREIRLITIANDEHLKQIEDDKYLKLYLNKEEFFKDVDIEKLNIAEILKYCPKGMELYSPLCGNCKLYDVNDYGIRIETPNKDTLISLYHDGRYCVNGEIMLFPKGKTNWKGFQRPLKDGDVVVCEENKKITQMFILKSQTDNRRGYFYTGYDFRHNEFFEEGNWYFDRLATEEEKQKLFNAIIKNGYKWNSETKTLEKLIEPKFKVGDRIKEKKAYISGIITDISGGSYKVEYKDGGVAFATIEFQDGWELVPDKFDIATLKPFDRVLVRTSKYDKWCASFFSHIDKEHHSYCYKYVTTAGKSYPYCIPFEGNQHLLNTTADCDDFYKTWE